MTESLFEAGMGSMVLVRGATPHQLHAGMFLLDTFYLGIKDAAFRPIDAELLEAYLDATRANLQPLVEIEPSRARRLLRELASWSQSNGIAPHRDFAVAERLFGDAPVDTSETAFQFGRDGEPVYIPGPSETASIVARRISQLLGDDGFETAA